MRLIFISIISICFAITAPAQDLTTSVKGFSDKQAVRHATIGFSLTDDSGKTLASINAESSLAPASTQKLLTSITALKVLGYDHKFVTTLSIAGSVVDSTLLGNVIIKSGGDPTLGSEDFKAHYGNFIEDWIQSIKAEGISSVNGRFLIDDSIFKGERNAGSSALNDVGNYYGSGAPGFSFMDNEFSVFFNTRGKGVVSEVSRTEPELPENITLVNEVKAADVRGDNVIIYSLENASEIFLKGKLPPAKTDFKVRGSIPDVTGFAQQYIQTKLEESGITFTGEIQKGPLFMNTKEIHRTKSPALIEILKVLTNKSVNTYADVILKHIGIKANNDGSFSGGIKAVRKYWKDQGLDVSGINIEDGSGLSRKNNVTAKFMTEVLASVSDDEQVNKMINSSTRAQSIKSMWGGEPLGYIQAKSGYIGRVRAYSGFLVKDDKKYPFHIMVNNYHASSGEIRKIIGEFLKECRTHL